MTNEIRNTKTKIAYHFTIFKMIITYTILESYKENIPEEPAWKVVLGKMTGQSNIFNYEQ